MTDPLLIAIGNGIDVYTELQNSVCLRVVMEAAQRLASLAKDKLAEVDPTDIKAIINLQCKAQLASFILSTLDAVIRKGEQAETTLKELSDD